jgi:O-antigen/teichoic acid export membrane protein
MLPEILQIKFKISKPLLSKVFKYSWPLVIVAIAGSVNQSSALIMQKYWLPGTIEENQAMVGIFSAGAKLAILLNLFTTAFNYAAEPFFFNNAARKDDKSIYGDVALAYTIFASITVLGTYLFIDIVMGLIGSTYREGIIVVPVLLIAFVFLGLYYMVAIWYKLSNNTKIGALVSLLGVLITVGFNYLMLPKYGIMGSAWASLTCYSFMVLVCYQWGKKYSPISYPWKRILLIIFVTASIVVLSNQLRDIYYAEKVLLYGMNSALFIGALIVFYLLERNFLLNLLKK